jgi:hypothetical protein
MLARVRSGPRRGIFLADLVRLNRPGRLLPIRPSCASLRTRRHSPLRTGKVARPKVLSARRRVWVRGRHNETSIDARGRSARLRLRRASSVGNQRKQQVKSDKRIQAGSQQPVADGFGGDAPPRKLTWPDAPACARRTHTRRRADRTHGLAIFHAGLDVTRSVRRNTSRIGRTRVQGLGRLNQAGSAREMPGLGPGTSRASIRARCHGPSVTQPKSSRTGGAVEARVTSCDLKGIAMSRK